MNYNSNILKRFRFETANKLDLKGTILTWHHNIIHHHVEFKFRGIGGFRCMHGKRIFYYGNGKIRFIENYKMDKKHGLTKSYHKNGDVSSDLIYENNKLKINEIQ